MPSKPKPIRLWLEPERRYPDGRLRSPAVWIIRDRSKKVSTGCGAGDHAGAEKALQDYLAKQHAERSLPKNRTAIEVPIADVLRHYVEVKGDTVASPGLLALRMGHLLGFWGDKTLDDIDTKTCARYRKHRHPYEGAARRELQDLQTAINQAKRDKLCREEVVVTLPPKPKARSDYLERDAIARLVWRAYRKRERQVVTRGPRKGQIIETSKRPTRHIARFILFGVYTGTRSRRIWQASFYREAGRPWIDVDGGIFYREAPNETASKTKRAPSIRIPGRLLAHLKRWRDGGHDPNRACRYLCEYRKGRPGDTKKAFARLVNEVLKEEGEEIVRHSLRHTAATWLLQDERDPHAVAGFLGMRTDTLIKVYGHHHPDYQDDIGDSFTRGSAGRRKGKKAPAKKVEAEEEEDA